MGKCPSDTEGRLMACDDERTRMIYCAGGEKTLSESAVRRAPTQGLLIVFLVLGVTTGVHEGIQFKK